MSGDAQNDQSKTPLRVRLPGFLTEEEIGLGDVIKSATASTPKPMEEEDDSVTEPPPSGGPATPETD